MKERESDIQRQRDLGGKFVIESQEERLRLGTDKMSNAPCWQWIRSVDGKGYGMVSAEGKRFKAHRLSYEIHKGKIPEGLQIDHLCRNRRCVNPDHLEAVTCKENVMRGNGLAALRSRQTHCKLGHELSGSNLRVNTTGGRICVTCQRERNRNRKILAKQKAAFKKPFLTG